jgi:hypothetical protein
MRFVSAPLISLVLLSGTASFASGNTAEARDIPGAVRVGDKELQLNGTATFRKWFFSIYEVGLYLEKRSTDAAKVVEANEPKRLHIHLLRDAPRDQLVNLLRWRLQTVAASGYERIRERVDRLLEVIPDARAGSDLVITYVPERGTVLTAEGGKQVVIEGKDFADALFNVWLADSRVRPGLMGG